MKYRNFLINKFINILIREGKKFKALLIFLHTMSLLRKNYNKKSLILLDDLITKIKPTLRSLKIRRGSKFIYLPKLLSNENQIKQGINWIIHFSRKKKTFLKTSLITEMINIQNNKGDVVNEKKKLYNLLLDSRPFLNLIKFY